MTQKCILILDYSVTKFETAAIKQWLPSDGQVLSLFVDTEESFPDDLIRRDISHVIHSGSEHSILDEQPFTKKAVSYIQAVRDKGIPQMGICFGHQLLCLALVGRHAVQASPKGLEAGWNEVKFTNNAMNMFGIKEKETIWQHHFDEVISLPAGSELLATNAHSRIQAFINREQNLFGTQFHPEIDLTTGNKFYQRGRKLLEKNNYDVKKLMQGSPSIDAGNIFFQFFLGQA